ncbi:MAG: bifunctional DNA-formamidopyrimidine glycosylase/DNA-(apurinic or apyrimidinic site) lyase [Planctomycetes bacterium]|nr:bifunctional DNA-formamidopyrimidine glycosylase/DNA-(apurinic or apyrimidinic site) lyase [Planctomycetota bacterium]
MPELPEVETMRRGIDPCIGMRIKEVEIVASPRRPIKISPKPAALRKRLRGTTIVGTDRAGKRVVLLLDTQDHLIFEPRMTGLVLLTDPPSQEHLRLRLQLGRNTQLRGVRELELLYWDRRGLGLVRLMSPSEFATAFGTERLGPDALGTTADILAERLGDSRRAIKVALLDQRAVAGIGNLYAAEILHRAQIHPATPCRRLRTDAWQRIAAATRRILAAAIRYEGSTLSDGTYRNALNQSGTYQNHHQVYDREGEKCRRCRKHEVRRIVQAQRATFFCPGCQIR